MINTILQLGFIWLIIKLWDSLFEFLYLTAYTAWQHYNVTNRIKNLFTKKNKNETL